MDIKQMVALARQTLNPIQLTENASSGSVAAVLVTDKGNVYKGVCIDVPCSMGFCAEHAAIAAMITAGESAIRQMVAVNQEGVIPPCGRCREFVYQINHDNINCEIVLKDRIATLDELLPERWC